MKQIIYTGPNLHSRVFTKGEKNDII